MKNRNRDLTTGVVWKKLLLFFLPIAAGTCIQQLYNTVDGLIVGKFVGTIALAAVGGSAAQIINLLIGFFVSVTSGASVILAQIFGAGKDEDVQRASGSAISLSALTGLALAVFGLAAAPWMLRMLHTPEETVAASVLYLRIYFAGVPCILVLNMASNMLRAVGDSFSPFLYMVMGCVLNIALDLLFVLVFNWGVAGVAVATVLAQVLNMLLLLGRLTRRSGPYHISLGDLRLRRQFLPSMLRVGIPSGLQASMYSVSNMIIQIGVNSLGTIVVASWAMTGKVDGIFWAVTNALGAAITTFVGQNLGAGHLDRIKQCTRQGFVISFSLTVSLSAGIMLLGRPILHILTDDPAVVDTTYLLMSYFVPFYFTWVLIEVFTAVLRGSGDAVNPVIIVGLGVCLFRVIWMVTVFAYFGTISALCSSYAISWVITGIALFIYYRRGNWLTRAVNRLEEK